MNTLDSFREAVREEEIKEETLKKERTPLMDPEMMKKKPSAKPKYAGKTAMRPMT